VKEREKKREEDYRYKEREKGEDKERTYIFKVRR